MFILILVNNLSQPDEITNVIHSSLIVIIGIDVFLIK